MCSLRRTKNIKNINNTSPKSLKTEKQYLDNPRLAYSGFYEQGAGVLTSFDQCLCFWKVTEMKYLDLYHSWVGIPRFSCLALQFLFSCFTIEESEVQPWSSYKEGFLVYQKVECVCWTNVSHNSLWRRANARNVSFINHYGGQFTFST